MWAKLSTTVCNLTACYVPLRDTRLLSLRDPRPLPTAGLSPTSQTPQQTITNCFKTEQAGRRLSKQNLETKKGKDLHGHLGTRAHVDIIDILSV